MPARVRGLTANDEAEWARYVSRIVALPGRRVTMPPEAAQVEPQTVTRPAVHLRRPGVMPVSRTEPPSLGIGGRPPGVDTATWQRFHRGRLDNIRKLDLHGMTAHHAFAALCGFLRTAHGDGVRCVEIVTGRGVEGGGVLRRELPNWLNLPEIRPLVLAAAHPRTSSAMHAHIANPGSVRLLIRRPRA